MLICLVYFGYPRDVPMPTKKNKRCLSVMNIIYIYTYILSDIIIDIALSTRLLSMALSTVVFCSLRVRAHALFTLSLITIYDAQKKTT